MKVYIYALIDPNTNEIRYIGKTKYKAQRKAYHNYDKSNKAKAEWINQLKIENKKPVFEILEECNESNWEKKEMLHISKAIKDGFKLLNISKGGLNRRERKDTEHLNHRIPVNIDLEGLNKAKVNARKKGFGTVSSYVRFLILNDK